MVNGEEVEDVEEFAQLGAIVVTSSIESSKIIENGLKNIYVICVHAIVGATIVAECKDDVFSEAVAIQDA